MSGVDVIGELLLDSPDIIAIAPEEQIRAGILPQGAPPTGIVLKCIGRPLHIETLAAEETVRFRERVQATAQAPDYETADTLVKLITKVCSMRTGNFGGVSDVSVTYGGAGPDFMDEDATLFMGSVDFFVSYVTPA
jgi:hypothetical protein